LPPLGLARIWPDCVLRRAAAERHQGNLCRWYRTWAVDVRITAGFSIDRMVQPRDQQARAAVSGSRASITLTIQSTDQLTGTQRLDPGILPPASRDPSLGVDRGA
jgi:hypothetical protein